MGLEQIYNCETGETTTVETEDIIIESTPPTVEETRQQLQAELSVLDNPRDAEDVYIALTTDSPLSAQTLERFTKKQALREQLKKL